MNSLDDRDHWVGLLHPDGREDHGSPHTGWCWVYKGYDPAEEPLREALCTLGNGRFATRGALPEAAPHAEHHYPGTYAAGLYNRLTSHVAGRDVENEDMVNLPDWLPLRFRPLGEGGVDDTVGEGGADDAVGEDRGDWPWMSPDTCEVSDYRQTLDLRAGTLLREMLLRDRRGRAVRVYQTRFVHMGDPQYAALRTEFRAEGWSGTLEVESAIEGDVTNSGVARYRALDGRHLTDHRAGHTDDGLLWLTCRTRHSDVHVAVAARTTVIAPEGTGPDYRVGDRDVAQTVRLDLADGVPVAVEKTVTLHTTHDPAISDPLDACLHGLRTAPVLDDLLVDHHTAWERLWQRAELHVPGLAGCILRLHLFHVLQTLSPHTASLDVGVPARGLHGEAYRGHVFWDEIFVLPYLNLHFPEVSRSLLMYRYRRLGRAVESAAEAGRRGAMFPWQSGSDGREETQTLHLNPRSGRWLPDFSRLQHHVGSAIAYNVWRYGRTTGDLSFLHGPGAEMVLQVARFWGDFAQWDADRSAYRLRGVVGPDEYHEAYPDSDRPGIDDNAYTNVTAAWVLSFALELHRELPEPRRGELADQLALSPEELERWEDVSRRLYVPWYRGVIDQFEGYGRLAELDWEGYREKYGDIRRLDRLLEAEGDSVNNYQASKQADVLMLGYLFPPDQLAALFERLGHHLDPGTWRRTVDHYLARTSGGSTLSSLVHAWVTARTHRAQAWRFSREALIGDVADIQGGTTPEGIHLGAMAGTLDLVQRGLTGLEATDQVLRLDPAPLPFLSHFDLSITFRGHWGVRLSLEGGRLRVTVPDSAQRSLPLQIDGHRVHITPGDTHTLQLPQPHEET
ncbi:glycoside hydrolase family 65 protein [Streptomyces alkaliterrae]|uniref:Glycoside hydrolase family 65 protein n=1 Tax=Streptomyces alkaliterrae TaxID=2213162 RepID=A0A7W3WYT1_9ACTN|nr:glycoside hydrolase family 65 protein [Streptomyces alkaliterrae]MBB1260715.1 glycoside hydrolase family 65 protein [Streptomyces alkaliterrae]